MICLVCLKESNPTLNIFDENGKLYNIASILRKHLWFEPFPEDAISTVVCCNCWQSVNDFHQFYIKVEQAHIALSRANITSIPEINIDSDFLVGPEATETIDVKEELMETVSENLNYQGNRVEALETKVEINPLDYIDTTCAKEEDTQLMKLSTTSGKLLLRNKPSTRFTSSAISDEKPLKRRKLARYKTTSNDDIGAPKRLKQNEQAGTKRQQSITEHELNLIAKHIPMQCELCFFITKKYNDFVDHFRQEHDGVKPNVKCCGRRLNRRFLFIQHALKHEDPEHFKCNECNKVFNVSDSLHSHMLENHAPKEKLKYACDACPKRFSKQHYLNLHKTTHIPPDEWKFFCEICPQPKYFASNNLLQVHRNYCHLKAANVCHVCAKEIRDNSCFEKHVRTHFEDNSPRVKCPHPGCDRYLKDKDNLRIHMRRHKEEGQQFACKSCNKLCKSRNALTSHFHYVHNNKSYNCGLCEKSFKKAITLKEHMVQHTGGVLYQCPFCTRTFNSNANMHSHKKKMHPVEWESTHRLKNK